MVMAPLYQCSYSGGADSSHEYYAEILRFQPDTGEWARAGSMLQPRYDHAAATIHFEDVRDVCFQLTHFILSIRGFVGLLRYLSNIRSVKSFDI